MFDDIRNLRDARPFQPFRIRMNDGNSYDVRHPETILLTKWAAYVAIPSDADRPDHAKILQVRNISSIEHIEDAHAA